MSSARTPKGKRAITAYGVWLFLLDKFLLPHSHGKRLARLAF